MLGNGGNFLSLTAGTDFQDAALSSSAPGTSPLPVISPQTQKVPTVPCVHAAGGHIAVDTLQEKNSFQFNLENESCSRSCF
jgi:hypothetical protein